MKNLRSEYETYFVEYYGDIKVKIKNLDYAFLYEELPIYYVVLVEEGKLKNLLEDIPEIISIQPNYIYELSQIEEKEYTIEDKCINLISNYDGKGIVVGVVATGIDYLDSNFITEAGECRIISIWDQTIEWSTKEEEFYGKRYNKEEILEAINLRESGDMSYKKVEHVDSSGYGTNLCKAIGGNRYNSVKYCEFAIVKLKRAEVITRTMNCIKFRNGNLYGTYDIIKALQYLEELSREVGKPMVIYLPVESNSGGRNGNSVLERYINYYSNINKNFFVVVNNGNEGDGYRHNEGQIETDSILYVPILVGKEMNVTGDERRYDFQISLWVNIHDKIIFRIISPNGETTSDLDSTKFLDVNTFDFNSGNIEVIYMAPSLRVGEKEILIKIKNAVQKDWLIYFEGKEIIYGDYDMWLPMKELTNYNINFRYPSKGRTLTTPATASKALTSMCYSQYEKGIRILSGKPCEDIKKRTKESLIIDSTGILIEDDYGIININGVAISGCILCWMVIIILQWAIVEGNMPNIDLNGIRLLLSKGAVKNLNSCYRVIDINKVNDLLV